MFVLLGTCPVLRGLKMSSTSNGVEFYDDIPNSWVDRMNHTWIGAGTEDLMQIDLDI